MTSSAANREPPLGNSPPLEFWEKVRNATHRLLMVDYDGTLVPYRVDWTSASISAATRELLQRISLHPQTSLVVFSGRRIAELESLLGPLPVHLVGEHGWEERAPDGRVSRRPLPGEMARWLGWAARAARQRGWEALLERKRCSLVLHTRRFSRDHAEKVHSQCERVWAPACKHGGFRLLRVDGGLELRAFENHEGAVVADLIAGARDDVLPVYLGDDLCDEEAFFEVLGRGVAIRVGTNMPDSIADFRLSVIDDVHSFLECWEETVKAA